METPKIESKTGQNNHIAGLQLNSIIFVTHTDVNDLHMFVTVALHTEAGEGDFAHDKLSRLKIVASGYGPLIYDSKKDPSFKKFQECCERVWEAVDQTSHEKESTPLPMCLVGSMYVLAKGFMSVCLVNSLTQEWTG